MKINANTQLIGDRVELVPYQPQHVERYYQWMLDPWLQEMTESEPLTLAEEYDMCESWRVDEDKCTFIVLDKRRTAADAEAAMAGDVNLFLNDRDDAKCAEINVMIAEAASRKIGCGREAVLLMMWYGIKAIGLTRFCAKILKTNTPSIALFQDKLGFGDTKDMEAFGEVHMYLSPTIEALETMLGFVPVMKDFLPPVAAAPAPDTDSTSASAHGSKADE